MLGYYDKKKSLRRALWLCLPFWIISFFYYHIKKVILGFNSELDSYFIDGIIIYILIISVTIVIFIITEFIALYLDRQSGFELKKLQPIVICIVLLFTGFWGPIRLSSEIFESPSIYKGYIKGTVWSCDLTIRKDHRFEIDKSVFGSSSYSYGSWYNKGDTIYLKYDKDSLKFKELFSDTLIAKSWSLVSLRNSGWSEPFRLTKKPN